MRLHYVLILCCFLPAFCFGQVSNGGFEEIHPNGKPQYWNFGPSGAALTKDSYAGNKAAKTWIREFYLSPEISSTTQDGKKLGTVLNGMPSQLTGYYKYEGKRDECQKAVFDIYVGSLRPSGGFDTVAIGYQQLKLSSKYKPFSINIGTASGGSPDRIVLNFKPQGRCHSLGKPNCCFLFIDELKLSGQGIVSADPDEETNTSNGKDEISSSNGNADPAEESSNVSAGDGKDGKKGKVRKNGKNEAEESFKAPDVNGLPRSEEGQVWNAGADVSEKKREKAIKKQNKDLKNSKRSTGTIDTKAMPKDDDRVVWNAAVEMSETKRLKVVRKRNKAIAKRKRKQTKRGK